MERDIKLVIFDFDGTLADTKENIILTFQMTMKELGVEIKSRQECAATIGLTLEDAFKVLYPGMAAEKYILLRDTYRRIFKENRKILVPGLFPEVMETLEELRRRGYLMSIASSRQSPSLQSFLEDMKIAHLFEYAVGGDNVEHPKPAPDAVLQILRHYNLSAEEAFVVGDMPFDINMATNAGVKSCGVTWGNADAAQLKESGANYVIDKMSQLLEILN
ncbi:MAG: HAD-IA family hydrolase [bacterium]|nr:HAD-IA family hydrolase [bacterium]MDY2650360.1 HAD-IA family hydrolase [Candidatus Egerieousia sp.]